MIDDVAKPEYAMLRKRLPSMGRNPLNPRLKILVIRFRYGLRIAVALQKRLKGRELAPTDISFEELKIYLVKFQEEKLLFWQGRFPRIEPRSAAVAD